MIDNIYSQVDWKCPIGYNTHMKIIKLNRRYRIFNEHRYQAGLRFNTYSNNAREIENSCRERLGPSDSSWTGYFGKRNVYAATPYFIMFRKESDLSFVLLCTDLTKKD
jgi:hypothetical protein